MTISLRLDDFPRFFFSTVFISYLFPAWHTCSHSAQTQFTAQMKSLSLESTSTTEIPRTLLSSKIELTRRQFDLYCVRYETVRYCSADTLMTLWRLSQESPFVKIVNTIIRRAVKETEREPKPRRLSNALSCCVDFDQRFFFFSLLSSTKVADNRKSVGYVDGSVRWTADYRGAVTRPKRQLNVWKEKEVRKTVSRENRKSSLRHEYSKS